MPYRPILRRRRSLPSRGAGRRRRGLYGDGRRDTILGYLRERNDRHRANRAMIYGRRTTPRDCDKDFEMERARLDEETKKEVEEEEKKLKQQEEERARLEAERLEELMGEILLVESIDEHIEENTRDHHTDSFDCTEDDDNPQLAVRRGQEFKMTLTFQRPYNKEADDLYIIFKTGSKPKIHKRTCAQIKLREDDKTRYMTGKKRTWGARIESMSGNSIDISVYCPPKAVIGLWEYAIRTVKGEEEFDYESKQDLIILLNPWCVDDEVYMEETDALKEYILNSSGAVFFGSAKKIRSKPWNYGQFQKGILPICLQLLRLADDGEVSVKMADPVYISRALSRILNCQDDGGVLAGRWDGCYDDGVRPLTWQGSAAILTEFRDKGEPVKYGQCWVFSHLLTTVARALGLPCRSVTNFASAHDTDGSMTIDKYVDDDGEEVSYANSDSVWNFHVWNEVWINRPDLDLAFGTNGKYDGWQAVDATPQEASDGLMQCGPAPLNAIKLGEVHVGHDTKFVFGEVNAECCDLIYGNPPTVLKTNSNRVGKFLSTKKPDGKCFKPLWLFEDSRLDVTHLYKAAEGSAAEREAVERATGHGHLGDLLFENASGVEISLVEEPKPDVSCEDFTLKVKVENTSSEPRSVILKMRVRPSTYWGVLIGKKRIAHQVFKQEELGPGESKEYELKVCVADCVKLCDDALAVRLLCLGSVKGFKKDPVFMCEDMALDVPGINVEGPGEPMKRGDMCDIKFSVKNPLQIPLTKCELRLDGSVFIDNDDFELKNAIYIKKLGKLDAGEEFKMTLQAKPSVKPKNSTDRELTITLASKEMPDMEGSVTMELI